MLQKKLRKKKLLKVVKYLLFFKIINKNQRSFTDYSASVFYKRYKYVNNQSLYKKLAFIGLSISIFSSSKFYSPKMKSLMYSIWDSVKTNTFII